LANKPCRVCQFERRFDSYYMKRFTHHVAREIYLLLEIANSNDAFAYEFIVPESGAIQKADFRELLHLPIRRSDAAASR